MKKGGSKRNRLLILAMIAVFMSGCGSKDMSNKMTESAYDDGEYYNESSGDYGTEDIYSYEASAAAPEEAVENMAAEEAGGAQTSLESPQVKDSNRKLIKNVNMEVETEEFDTLLSKVEKKVNALGGYIESSYTYNGSSYYGSRSRDASMTIRIPAEKLDDFLSEVAESSNVISRNDSITDVTLQYVDLESHKKVLLAEQDRLLELMEQVETIEDIIALESRLSEVRYQLESMESQLRTYDNQISYSTIYLNINEVTKLTPVKEQSTWEKISTGFVDSLYGVGAGLMNFIIRLIINLPYLVLWAVVILVIVLIIKMIRKSMKKRKEKRRQLQASSMTQPSMQAQPQMQENLETPAKETKNSLTKKGKSSGKEGLKSSDEK